MYAMRASSVQPDQDTHAAQQAAAQKSPAAAEKPAGHYSTPEDRKRLVAIARKLEAAPLDPSLAQDRSWAVSWVVTAPDVHVKICATLLSDLRRPKYKYKLEMDDQLLISSAAFVTEHSEQANSMANQSVAGMEGVLKAYSAILKAEPQATVASLDALLQKRREGKLADAVYERVKDCH
jgi:hypothetical protein